MNFTPQVDIKLLKRQDLVSVMSNMMKPAHDQVQIRVNMNSDEMDSFVFCLSGKKVLNDITAEPGLFLPYFSLIGLFDSGPIIVISWHRIQ